MFELPPPDPSVEIHLTSRGYSKGLAQTDGAQLLLRGELALGPVFAQMQWKNVDTNNAGGEAALLVGLRREIGGFELGVTAGHKFLTGVAVPTDDNAFEFTVSAGREFGRFKPRLVLTWSPDDLGGTRRSLYAEASASFRLFGNTSLTAYAGRRERSGGDDYTTFGAGISQKIGEHLTAELRWHDSAESARSDAYEGRAVASLRLRF
jgi:hypothetical protein